MIYKIEISQSDDNGFCNESSETYSDLETLKKAFEQMDSEQMFGELIDKCITPCWENDCYSKVVRKKRNITTRIVTSCIVPKTMDDLRLFGAFAFARINNLIFTF